MPLPRLLVIDDDTQLARALGRMLRHTFRTTIAPTLTDARSLLAAESFDVILCDIRMPSMSGELFVATLPEYVSALVVFMSGDEVSANVAPVHPRLLKPFTKEELLRAVACRCPAAA